MAARGGNELTASRIEHIETLERLGRLIVESPREPSRRCFVRLDAFEAKARNTFRSPQPTPPMPMRSRRQRAA